MIVSIVLNSGGGYCLNNLIQYIGNKLINSSKFLISSNKFCGDVSTSPHKHLSNKTNSVSNYGKPKVTTTIIRGLGIFLLIGCLILASVSTALCRSPAPIVYVAGDGSGDFNCDGRDDHVQINQALKFVADDPDYTHVYLKGPFTYVINDTLLIG